MNVLIYVHGPSPVQINTVILILTVVSIVRGKKFGGGEVQVKTRTLVKYVVNHVVYVQ